MKIGSTIPRPDWKIGQIKGSEIDTLRGNWAIAIATGFMFLLFTWYFQLSGEVLLIFSTIPLFFLAKAIRESIRLQRFGDPILELNAEGRIPLGRTVEGRINIGSSTDHAPEFTLTLVRIHREVTHRGRNTSVSESVLSSVEKKATLLPGGILPVSIEIPTDQPEINGGCGSIVWRLIVEAPFSGLSFYEEYDLPVY
jgi:hypothetical protein